MTHSLFLTVNPIGFAIGGILGGSLMSNGRRRGLFLADTILFIGVTISVITSIDYIMLAGRLITATATRMIGAITSKFT